MNNKFYNSEKGGGLQILPEDKRDFKLDTLGGVFQYLDIPKKSFRVVESLNIRDQKSDDSCTARTVAAILDDTEHAEISEEFQFAFTKKKEGSIEGWGANLRDAFSIPMGVGAVKKKDVPFTFDSKGRDFCADWNNYDFSLLNKANVHKQKTYFRADDRKGVKDYFDSLILSLYQNLMDKRTLGLGILWNPQWNDSKDGVIDQIPSEHDFLIGHALKGIGLEISPITKKEYLVVQNSGGTDTGDHGVFYLNRGVVNMGKPFGSFMFIDLPDEVVSTIKNPTLCIKVKNYFRSLFF